MAAAAASIEDPGTGRNSIPIDEALYGQDMPNEGYDMLQWEDDPGVPRGEQPTSSPAWKNDALVGSQSSQKVRNALPWNQVLLRNGGVADTTIEADTTSLGSIRSFSLETPTGLRRPSKRQSSIGAASAGFDGGEEDDFIAAPVVPANSQEVVDREVANFLSFVGQVRAQVPLDQPLFFSDLAPVADTSPYVAARAFYNTLALVTARSLKVEQQKPFADIKIDILSV
ncbi:hypothetical protein CBS101457_004558 [Exobasidium rhododendri]|nr:hypothetical protein CBS101457_004558 [Exobasidium rhododendri]